MHVCIMGTNQSAFEPLTFGKEAVALAEAGFHVTILVPGFTKFAERPQPSPHPNISTLLLCKRVLRGRADIVAAMPKLLRTVLRLKPDVLELTDLQGLAIGVLVKALTGARLIFNARENYPWQLAVNSNGGPVATRVLFTCFWLLEAALSRFADHVFVVDAGRLQRFRRLGRPASLLQNLPRQSFAQPRVEPASEGQGSKEPFELIFVGTLSDRIAIGETIEAVARVRAWGSQVQATYIGGFDDPALKQHYRDLANRLGIAEHIRFVGHVPHAEVPQRLRSASAGSLLYRATGYRLRAPYSVKLYEYMACGLPVLCTDLPELAEPVNDMQCGIAVDPTDIDALAVAIERLASAPEEARAMGRRAAIAFHDRFSWEKIEPEYVAIVRRLSSRRSSIVAS